MRSHRVGSRRRFSALFALTFGVLFTLATPARAPARDANLEWIRVDAGTAQFVREDSRKRFVAWGFNYDHDDSGRLLEDYWEAEWPTVEQDFREMKDLGANVVRIHLQFGKFMSSPTEPNPKALQNLARLVRLAESTRVYLDLTGLGCYRKNDVPAWYDALDERDRWAAQARFWQAVAKTCANSPAVFCYDLMNEPLIGGSGDPKAWLPSPFGDMYFVQRITLTPGERTREQIAKAWIETLTDAIRKEDRRHLITVGEIPWGMVFPGAQPLFSGKETGERLDFASIHVYPKKGEIEKALEVVKSHRLGKPVLIEEMFPLECSLEELDAFIEASRPQTDGWIGFYWGKTPDDYQKDKPTIAGGLMRAWLKYFRSHAQEKELK